MRRVQRQALVFDLGPRDQHRTITRTLAQLDFAVSVATDFAAARRLVISRPLNLLITDVRLGPFNGLELVLAGKSAAPAILAIVVGDHWDLRLRNDAADAGATFLLRPVRSDALVAVLRGMMAPPHDGKVHDLHGRLEHKRQEIERERHTVVRRRVDTVATGDITAGDAGNHALAAAAHTRRPRRNRGREKG